MSVENIFVCLVHCPVLVVILCCFVSQDQAQLLHVVQCLNVSRDNSELDPEAYQRLVVTARAVALNRPYNLVKFAERDSTLVADNMEAGRQCSTLADKYCRKKNKKNVA